MARPTLTLLAAACLLAGFAPAAQAQLTTFEPITDAELLDPDPADWLNWRRTIDGQGYSPLDQIDRDNVGSLQLAWSWETYAGTSQITPLVHDGVMFVPSRSGVVALDAANGDVLWTHLRTGRPARADSNLSASQQPGLARRNLAIYGDKLYAGTSEAQLIALDVRSGEVVWERQVADHDLGYQYTSGPIIVKGMVVAGITGCEYYKNDVCFISAHDARDRRPAVAHLDSGPPRRARRRHLGRPDAYVPGRSRRLDPRQLRSGRRPHLLVHGAAQALGQRAARHRGGCALQQLDPGARPGDRRDPSGTSSTFRPRRTTSTRCSSWCVVRPRRPAPRCSRWARSASCGSSIPSTGEYLAAHDLGFQDIVDLASRETGQGILRRERIPQLDVPVDYCPGPGGLKNLWAMAYHPETEAFYISADARLRPLGRSGPCPSRRRSAAAASGRTTGASLAHPQSPEHLGIFAAMSSRTGELLWTRPSRLQYATSSLTTGGGLVFVGNLDRNIYAMDVRSGEVLWSTRAPTSIDGFPITYAVDGRQYVAVPSGRAGSWRGATPSWCSTTCSARAPAAPSCTSSRCRNSPAAGTFTRCPIFALSRPGGCRPSGRAVPAHHD